jgi:hypothetical protein
MKKTSTWYLIALTILNVGLAQGTSAMTGMWTMVYRKLGFLPPEVTVFALRFDWWPYLFAGFAVVLALVSMGSPWLSSRFYHFIIILLVVECFILFMSQIVFALPLISMMTFR